MMTVEPMALKLSLVIAILLLKVVMLALVYRSLRVRTTFLQLASEVMLVGFVWVQLFCDTQVPINSYVADVLFVFAVVSKLCFLFILLSQWKDIFDVMTLRFQSINTEF